jgi:hypothetical protein
MTAAEHATEAERLLAEVAAKKISRGPQVEILAARANAHATLAVYYATIERS